MANIEYKQLEVVQAMATIIIDQKMIEHQFGGIHRYVQTILPMSCEHAVLSLVELFAADNIKNIEWKAPLNWWEALKEAHAPQMYLDRYPVKYRRYSVDIKAIWQGYKPSSEKFGPYLPYTLERVSDDGDDE